MSSKLDEGRKEKKTVQMARARMKRQDQNKENAFGNAIKEGKRRRFSEKF
jgi:hypothetical protein